MLSKVLTTRAIEAAKPMMNQEDQGDLPDVMGLATTLGGYGLCTLLIFLMFYLADQSYK